MFLGLDSSLLTFLLPFLLMLAIVYGALQMGSPFKNKAVNFIIAVVIAIFAASFAPAVELINSVLPYAAGIFVIVFVLGFLKKSFGGKRDYTLIAIVAGLAAIFLASPMGAQLLGSDLGPISSENLAALAGVVFVLIMIVVAYKYWNKGSTDPNAKSEDRG